MDWRTDSRDLIMLFTHGVPKVSPLLEQNQRWQSDAVSQYPDLNTRTQAFTMWCSWGIHFTAAAKWWLHIWQALEYGCEKWYLHPNDCLTLSLFASRWFTVTCHSDRYWWLSEWRMNTLLQASWKSKLNVCTPASSKFAVLLRKATENWPVNIRRRMSLKF
jgi:hypothetical protein